MEHKTRRRDLMSEEQVRFDYFDRVLPEDIYTGKLFEQWRKMAEQSQPRILYLTKALLLEDASTVVDVAQFPDVIKLGQLKLKLAYHFDPTHKADGITLRLPMLALGQLEAKRFEWLVPGMLEEKLVFMINVLPKSLRKNFVPAPQFAKACAESMVFAEGSLALAFSRALKRMTGIEVSAKTWNNDALPKHLQMNYAVLDEHGTIIAQDMNLQLLQHRYGQQARDHLQQRSSESDIRRSGITRWDFDLLPESIQSQQGRSVMQFFPALVDQQQSVSIELFESSQAANSAMHAGLRRLMMLSLHVQQKALKHSMPRQTEMSLYYATIGKSEVLLEDIISNTFDAVFLDDQVQLPREQRAYEHLLQTRKSKVVGQGETLALYVFESLKAYASLQAAITNVRAAALKPIVVDIQSQMHALIYDGFVAHTPAHWLQHLPRFIQAAEIRLGRAGPNLKQDQFNAQAVQSLWHAYQTEIKARQMQLEETNSLTEFRWMLEELRNALFART